MNKNKKITVKTTKKIEAYLDSIFEIKWNDIFEKKRKKTEWYCSGKH